jgi:hypothetical protein
VGLHGVHRQVELAGDLLVRDAGGDQGHHVRLPRCERDRVRGRQLGALPESEGHDPLAGVDLLQCSDELEGWKVLGEVAVGSAEHGPLDEPVATLPREHRHARGARGPGHQRRARRVVVGTSSERVDQRHVRDLVSGRARREHRHPIAVLGHHLGQSGLHQIALVDKAHADGSVELHARQYPHRMPPMHICRPRLSAEEAPAGPVSKRS